MSGGSYNYLCFKNGGELVAGSSDEDLDDMVNRLAGLGYAEDAAKETMTVLLEIRAARVRVDAMIRRLSDVWKAVEWRDSGDSGDQEIKDALKAYRGTQ